MSDASQQLAAMNGHAAAGERESIEVVDALPVLASAPVPVAPSGSGTSIRQSSPARQAAAAAVGGVVAGAAVVGLVRRRRARAAVRAAARARSTRGPMGELVHIVGTRSVLVDVHLLGGRGR